MAKKRKRNTNTAGDKGAHENNLTYGEIWDDSALINSWNDAVEEYKRWNRAFRLSKPLEATYMFMRATQRPCANKERIQHYHSLHRLGQTVVDKVLDENSDANSEALTTAFERAEDHAYAGAGELEPKKQDDGGVVNGNGQTEDALEVEVDVKIEEPHAVPKADTIAKHNIDLGAEESSRNSNATHGHNGQEGTTNQPSFPENLLNTGSFGRPSSQSEAMKHLMMSWYWAGYYTGLHEGQRKAAGSSAINANNTVSGSSERKTLSSKQRE
ncbi:MAG: hypothetical protein M1831_003352 [Alyxoria varia]|nr:MAG: hypothetical protein M1831_003352 [Alyxoria varia]